MLNLAFYLSIAPISIVVYNLHPFTSTVVRPGSSLGSMLADAVELIDIGVVTLLRAAIKNRERISALSDPADYADFVKAWAEEGSDNFSTVRRSRLVLMALEMTARYGMAISVYFCEQYRCGQRKGCWTGTETGTVNPHQKPGTPLSSSHLESQPSRQSLSSSPHKLTSDKSPYFLSSVPLNLLCPSGKLHVLNPGLRGL